MQARQPTPVRMVRLGSNTYLHAVDLLTRMREIAAEHRDCAGQQPDELLASVHLAVAYRMEEFATEVDLQVLAIVSRSDPV